MGLFDFITNIENKESAGITLEEYGELIANWAVDQRRSVIDSLLKLPKAPINDQESLIQKFEENKAYGEIIFIGLNIAIYLEYAVDFLKFSKQENVTAMMRGVKSGLAKQYAGDEDKEKLANWILIMFSRFFEPVSSDFALSSMDLNRTYLAFISVCNEAFKPIVEFSSVELMGIHPMIQNYPMQVAQLVQPLITRIESRIYLNYPN